MIEDKPSLAIIDNTKKKSKYTDEQKIAAVEALVIMRRLNKKLKRILDEKII